MTDTAQPAIKPGDVVRSAFLGGDGIVLQTRMDGRTATILLEDFRAWDVMTCTLVRRQVGSDADERSAILFAASALPSILAAEHRVIARAEALRRGWRELDREDVTLEPRVVRVHVGSAFIGILLRDEVRDLCHWSLHESGPDIEALDGRAETQEAALDALIAAENARRKETAPCR